MDWMRTPEKKLADDAKHVEAAIRGLSETMNNGDCLQREWAVKAAAEGRPAFWTNQRYHNAVASIFLDSVNRNNLTYALETWAKEKNSAHPASVFGLLNSLIPLNIPAHKALEMARTVWLVTKGVE